MKTIPEFPNYSITKDGRVWSKPRRGSSKNGKWLKLVNSPAGYLRVNLCKDKETHRLFIHHLVLNTFIGKCPKNMECRHLDGNRQNNKLSNLKWGTRSENSYDAVKHGTHPGLSHKGEKHPNSKLTNKDVKFIIDNYNNGAYKRKELAVFFGVSYQNVCDIISGRRWKHIWIT